LPPSATRAKEPSEETLTPVGELKKTLEPTPFVEPEDEASPARVETVAVEMTILRIRLLPQSATRA
jgi:hypothetical protein